MTGNELNREILRLAVPSILANITVPIVGLVDTAIAGHLAPEGAFSAASYIGAISLGSMLLTLLYWCFSFLRTAIFRSFPPKLFVNIACTTGNPLR